MLAGQEFESRWLNPKACEFSNPCTVDPRPHPRSPPFTDRAFRCEATCAGTPAAEQQSRDCVSTPSPSLVLLSLLSLSRGAFALGKERRGGDGPAGLCSWRARGRQGSAQGPSPMVSPRKETSRPGLFLLHQQMGPEGTD